MRTLEELRTAVGEVALSKKMASDGVWRWRAGESGPVEIFNGHGVVATTERALDASFICHANNSANLNTELLAALEAAESNLSERVEAVCDVLHIGLNIQPEDSRVLKKRVRSLCWNPGASAVEAK